MAQHGGVFENYYARANVTHIICSNLTDQKVKNYAKERCVLRWLVWRCRQQLAERMHVFCRDPKPIIRPEWIVDSIAAGRRLPVRMPPACTPRSQRCGAQARLCPADRRLQAVAPAGPARAADAQGVLCAAACALRPARSRASHSEEPPGQGAAAAGGALWRPGLPSASDSKHLPWLRSCCELPVCSDQPAAEPATLRSPLIRCSCCGRDQHHPKTAQKLFKTCWSLAGS